MNVTARGNVEVVLGDLLVGDDARVLFDLLPCNEGVGNPENGVLRDVVFGVALYELTAGIEEKQLALSGPSASPCSER